MRTAKLTTAPDMLCKCGKTTKVIDSIEQGTEKRWRRRECRCDRFNTIEITKAEYDNMKARLLDYELRAKTEYIRVSHGTKGEDE